MRNLWHLHIWRQCSLLTYVRICLEAWKLLDLTSVKSLQKRLKNIQNSGISKHQPICLAWMRLRCALALFAFIVFVCEWLQYLLCNVMFIAGSRHTHTSDLLSALSVRGESRMRRRTDRVSSLLVVPRDELFEVSVVLVDVFVLTCVKPKFYLLSRVFLHNTFNVDDSCAIKFDLLVLCVFVDTAWCPRYATVTV